MNLNHNQLNIDPYHIYQHRLKYISQHYIKDHKPHKLPKLKQNLYYNLYMTRTKLKVSNYYN